MAVTVKQSPFVLLDEDYRIVEVDSPAEAAFGPLLGRNVFDCFPDATSLYRPYYEKARATGKVVEFAQYYDGYVMLINARPVEDGGLVLGWEILGMLDTMTLDALCMSLGRILAKLGDEEKRTRQKRQRASLRLIEGGA